MIGQGSPKAPLGRCTPVGRTRSRYWCALLTLLAWVPAAGALGDETLRIRIAWGGGSERTWQGSVALSEGTLAELQPLGIETDESGSMWLEGDGHPGSPRLVVRQRSPRTFDGADLLLSAPLTAKLTVQLVAVDDSEHPASLAIPLGDLLGEAQSQDLDNQGNRLLVERAPGDTLRVNADRDALIFAPEEVFKFAIEPALLPMAAGSKVQLKVQLLAARSQRELWSQQHNIQVGQQTSIPLEVPLGSEEGAYDIVVTAAQAHNWQETVRQPLNWKKTVIDRSIQVLVLNPNRPVSVGQSQPELTPAVQIDPANPRWWDLLSKLPQLPKIPRLWKGPLGNGNARVWKHPLGEMVRLNPSSESPDVSWEAYTLPISQPGRPHIVEVEYPSDVPQTLGISILEPNASGAVMPIGLDSGVDVSDDLAGSRTARWLRHRLIFWPRTTNPLLLMTNCRDRSPAVYGKIRVLAGWEHLPGAMSVQPPQGQRLMAAYLDRPLFPQSFSASEALDSWSGHSLEDWVTFYEGGTRLVEYLNYVGYNGLVLSVMADGSTIYPSTVVSPTPRYDKGALFATGQDPVRKDALEMLFRLFDREQLQLIPALDFSAPLPELESLLRRDPSAAEGLLWIGPDGMSLQQIDPPRRGASPYYNVLDPRVQQAMLAVVRELAARYGHHPSFSGLAIQLSAQGYAQLPGPEWGVDDATIARFQQETRLKLPAAGQRRFAERAESLTGPNRSAWLQWRAETLSRFHRQIQAEVTAVRPGARLYLTGANLFSGEEMELQLRPTLTRRATLAEALLHVGIDAQHYQSQQGPVLLRPERIVPASAFAAWAASLELAQMSDADLCFQGAATPGSLFFHQPQETRIESFDAKSPFKPTYTRLVSQLAPSDGQNRRRFVHSLATLDSQLLIDGGWLLPLGQEDSTRNVIAAYRHLPAVRFQRVGDARETVSSQPVTFRSATCGDHTYVYAVNDAPFAVTGRLRVEAPAGCRLEELTGSRQVAPLRKDAEGTYWAVELEPYDLVAVRLSQPGVQLSQLQVVPAAALAAALQQRIRELGGRAAALRTPPPLKVPRNAGFELPPTGEEQVADWAATKRPGVSVRLEKSQAHSGNQSAHINSNGPVACLVSRPFAAPTTGRLTMSAWLRVADAARQPPLRLALEGKRNGQPYYRYAEVGSAAGGAQAASPIGVAWAQYVFPIDDLPLEGLTQLWVRFDLMGPGEVWIDDVQLFDLAFSESECRELARLITVAEYHLRNQQIGDCIRLLEGYWPRFLEGHVPLERVPTAVAQKPGEHAPAADDAAKKDAPRAGLLERVKNLVPGPLRF